MSIRQPFVGGNWKMHTLRPDAIALAQAVASRASEFPETQTACFPPFVWLAAVADALSSTHITSGGQDLSEHAQGAFTGEISADMLLDAGCTCVLTGHSERRHIIGESNELVGKKTATALNAGLQCILCVGETLEQRDAGSTDTINEQQLRAALADVSPDQLDKLVIAYEPVWAIGTGRTAQPGDAQSAHNSIRTLIASMYDAPAAESIRIIYGGSVKPDNASELFSMPDIDGGLIGGASLDADAFVAICQAAQETYTSAQTQESVGER